MTFIEHSHVDIEVHEFEPDILASVVCLELIAFLLFSCNKKHQVHLVRKAMLK